MMDEEAHAWKIEQVSFKHRRPIVVSCCSHVFLQISKAYRVHQVLIKHQKQKRKGLHFTSPASKKSKSSGSMGKPAVIPSQPLLTHNTQCPRAIRHMVCSGR